MPFDAAIEELPRAASRERRGAKTAGLRLYAGAPEELLRRRRRDGPRLIVTPNLDHLRLLDAHAALRRAYAAADVVVNDSRFLRLAVFRDRALCYPGSELAPDLLMRAPPGARVLVVGGSPAFERWAARRLPSLRLDLVEPSRGFVFRRAERRALVERARATRPQLILVCTGAPQSELLAAQMRRALVHPCDIVCCGGALQFMAGEKSRAPGWMRALGVEWLFRFLCEPHTRRRYRADVVFLWRRRRALLALRRGGTGRFLRFVLELAPER